ncbi:MAG: helix-turn-helix domain-containing protein [Ruminococcus sp.]|nr:helix-turn-helix domain-containing protein [Ruminococcus sp.]
MTIAERIQNLRKARGISQEDLAEQIGVSRQAVSKWESEQSMPDIDKIISVSEFFGVSTDYLLRGVENVEQHEVKADSTVEVKAECVKKSREADAGVFAIVGTALNFIGLIIAAAIWFERNTFLAAAIGLIIMAMGTMMFAMGQRLDKTKPRARKIFWLINVWIIFPIPIVLCAYLMSGFLNSFPTVFLYGAFWAGYFILCVIWDIVIFAVASHKSKQNEK